MKVADKSPSQQHKDVSAYRSRTQKNPAVGNNQKTGKLRKADPPRRKELNYNSHEIRSSLVRVTRSQSAGLVLNTAKSKLVSLLKCKGTGMFNENELNAAIVHARRMVRCARLKYQNLTKEEQQIYRNEKAAEKEAADPHLGQVQKALRLKQRKRALEQKRRLHRNLEHARLNQADEEYKSRQARNSQDGKNSSPQPYFPSQDLSSLKLRELELEISREGALLSMESSQGADVSGGSGIAPDGGALSPAILAGSIAGSFENGSAPADIAGGSIDIGL